MCTYQLEFSFKAILSVAYVSYKLVEVISHLSRMLDVGTAELLAPFHWRPLPIEVFLGAEPDVKSNTYGWAIP